MACSRRENCSIFIRCCVDKCHKSRNFRFNTFRNEIESGAKQYKTLWMQWTISHASKQAIIEYKVSFLAGFAQSILSLVMKFCKLFRFFQSWIFIHHYYALLWHLIWALGLVPLCLNSFALNSTHAIRGMWSFVCVLLSSHGDVWTRRPFS